jgi:cytochrome c553
MFVALRLAALAWILGSAQGLAGAAPAFEDSMAQRLLACTGCHGKEGRAGPDGYYPRLAGKPAGYLYNQLRNVREGRRHYPLMLGLLDPMDDAYLRAIAAHFASLSVPYPPPKPSTAAPGLLEQGRLLATEGRADAGIPACTQCHGNALMGVNPSTPGLLGLPADYLNAQLGGWQTGQRRAAEPDCMAKIAKQLSGTDINAVAQWLSSQAVPANAKPADTKPASGPATIDMRCGSAP